MNYKAVVSYVIVLLFLSSCVACVASNGGGGGEPSINGKIVFHSNRDGSNEIYTMNADGSNVTRLTNNAYDDVMPGWSPDGSKIAFSSTRDGNYEIYTMNADGSNVTRLTNNAYDDRYSSWSRDGKIAFSRDLGGNWEIYTMNADGSGETRLTNNGGPWDLGAYCSPDGTKIVFISHRDGDSDIYVMNANGSGETKLTYNSYEEELATWSPDGSKILFASTRDGNYEIYTMNADGSNVTRLTNNGYDDAHNSWSPDGSMIVFLSDRDGNSELYVMNADGSGQTRLTSNDDSDVVYGSAWQPLFISAFQQEGIGIDFPGSVLSVDGTPVTNSQLPASFSWQSGTAHSFSWSSPLVVNEGKRYVWSSASGLSAAKSGTISAPSANGSVTADYDTQYYVTFQAATGGSVSKTSGWYNDSSTISVSATAANGYAFTGWSVSGSLGMGGAGQSIAITVNGPGTVSANFEALDLTPPSITNLLPANGSTSASGSVTISATYSDNVAVDPASVVLRVDGTNVTSATVTATGITYNATLAAGSHSVELTVKDTSGNPQTATWSFTVQEPPKSGCFIATATYGSEAAPQVQALREFRDGITMKTFAGSSFMTGFLTWYYSWSPPVADTIAPDGNAKAVMRVVLQPLLSILDVAASVDSALSFNGELAIVAAGFAAASLIGIVYFLPLTTLALVGAKRYRKGLALPGASRVLLLAGVPWAISVALIAVAEVALSPALMVVATLAFVALTILMVVGTVSVWLARNFGRG